MDAGIDLIQPVLSIIPIEYSRGGQCHGSYNIGSYDDVSLTNKS